MPPLDHAGGAVHGDLRGSAGHHRAAEERARCRGGAARARGQGGGPVVVGRRGGVDGVKGRRGVAEVQVDGGSAGEPELDARGVPAGGNRVRVGDEGAGGHGAGVAVRCLAHAEAAHEVVAVGTARGRRGASAGDHHRDAARRRSVVVLQDGRDPSAAHTTCDVDVVGDLHRLHGAVGALSEVDDRARDARGPMRDHARGARPVTVRVAGKAGHRTRPVGHAPVTALARRDRGSTARRLRSFRRGLGGLSRCRARERLVALHAVAFRRRFRRPRPLAEDADAFIVPLHHPSKGGVVGPQSRRQLAVVLVERGRSAPRSNLLIRPLPQGGAGDELGGDFALLPLPPAGMHVAPGEGASSTDRGDAAALAEDEHGEGERIQRPPPCPSHRAVVDVLFHVDRLHLLAAEPPSAVRKKRAGC